MNQVWWRIELLRLPDAAGEEVLSAVGGGGEHADAGGAGEPAHALGEVLDRRDDREADGADGDADGVEEAAHRAPRDARREEGVEQVVLHALADVGLVGLDALRPFAVAGREDPTEEMVERPEGADPTAEDAAEDEREREHAHRPGEPAIDVVRREHRHRGDEGIGEQERLDRLREADARVGAGEGASEGGLEEQPGEQEEEARLRRAPNPNEDADDRARGEAAAGARLRLEEAANARAGHGEHQISATRLSRQCIVPRPRCWPITMYGISAAVRPMSSQPQASAAT